MRKQMRVFRTERIWLKSKEQLRQLCHMSKNLYNEANYLVRQAYFNQKEWIQIYQFREELANSSNFQQLPIHTAKKVLWNVDKAWKSFFAANADWKTHPEKYFTQPRIPKYKPKNGQFQVAFEKKQVTFSNGILSLPQITGVQVKPRLASPSTLISVRIIPKGVGYVLEIIYSKYVPSVPKQAPVQIAGIDIGLTNLITMVNNIGKKPIVVKGGVVKSINQYYNKERTRLQSVYDRQGIKSGLRLTRLTTKRNRKIDYYFHEVSRFVIQWCQENQIDTLIIGYNKNWKQYTRLGKRTNQNFVLIPFNRLIEKLEYKAQDAGIRIIKTPESYTSKCSFLDCEEITYHSRYLGDRISRGIFQSSNGISINSDVNAGYNIIKKEVPNAFSMSEIADGIEGVWLHPVRWNRAAVVD